jgi:rubrerythrin
MLSEIPAGFGKVKETDTKMSDAELARIGLIAELDAINLYEQMAALAKDPLVKKVFLDIAGEEKEHVGEFLELLKRLDEEQIEALEHGAEEVKEMEA